MDKDFKKIASDIKELAEKRKSLFDNSMSNLLNDKNATEEDK